MLLTVTGHRPVGLVAAAGAALGLALAGRNRDGPRAMAGALAAFALVAGAVQQPWIPVLALVSVATLLAVATAWLLRRMAFNGRLERPDDVLRLVMGGVCGTLALVLVWRLLHPWVGADAATTDPGITRYALAALGGFFTTALPACTLSVSDRPVHALGWIALAGAAALIAGTPLAAWQVIQGSPMVIAWYLPFIGATLAVFVVSAGWAAVGVMAASLLAAWLVRTGPESAQSQVMASHLALQGLLWVAHAARAEFQWREQRLEWALDGSRLGVADWQLRGRDAFVSAAWRSLTGFDGAHWSPDAWVLAVHPDDQPELRMAMAQVSTGEVGRTRLELRMPVADTWRWLEATLLVIERDAGGVPQRLLATLLDVEERHDAQERQRLSASLFQHLHEGLLITDAEMRVLDVNPAYAQILGVTRGDVVGTVPSLLRPTPADPLARQQRAAMWTGLRSTGGWRGELLERRRSGEICTLQVTISCVNSPQGDVRYHVLVITDVTEQRVQRERLERQAHFDELTRLPNRARLSQLLGDAMRAADHDGYLLVVCYLDLDRFKPVNDRYGHAAGDRLLIDLAGRLRSALRTRDAWADTAARLGGDEFVLLLRADTLDEARMAVERVLRVVAQPYVVDPAEDPVQVTASMGATVYPIDRSDADTLLRHADHAMYGAKQSGRNGYLFFDPEHRRRTEERVMAIGRVQEALDQAEFVLHYQPKVDMRSGRVLGFEALLRWDHPQHGLIAPMQFLPLIENTGLSSRVGDWVFAQALEHLSQWRRGGLDISVSVNVSARHLQEPDFAQRLSELLARHSEPLATHFELEMLETAAHADVDATSALMARCRALGVRFALDDFGTGYSTLTYLKRLPVDVLKVDRSFVNHMLDDSQDRAIVEGVVGLARTFGCVVVAEGVESPAQARTLLDMGCDIGQGTGIAAPMPAGQVAAWARQYKGVFALSTAAPVGGPPDDVVTGAAS